MKIIRSSVWLSTDCSATKSTFKIATYQSQETYRSNPIEQAQSYPGKPSTANAQLFTDCRPIGYYHDLNIQMNGDYIISDAEVFDLSNGLDSIISTKILISSFPRTICVLEIMSLLLFLPIIIKLRLRLQTHPWNPSQRIRDNCRIPLYVGISI